MTSLQQNIIILFGLLSLYGAIRGFYESGTKNNSYGKTLHLVLTGSFVWADAAIFGIFWTLLAFATVFLNDWFLFLLAYSLFWLIRAIGETIFWFNYQFSKFSRNPIDKIPFLDKVFKDESMWFVYQIIWQCVTVLAAISSLYFGRLWLTSL